MSKKRLETHPAAVRESSEAYLWYAARSPSAAEGFADELDRAIEAMTDRPSSFLDYLYGTRRCLLHRYPYLVVFVEQPDRIRIIAIAHGNRRPGYWRRRIK